MALVSRWGIIAILLGMNAGLPPVLAQAPASGTGNMSGLATRSRGIRYEIVSGRITAVCGNYSANVESHLTNQQTGTREDLLIVVTSGFPAIHFEMASARESLTISLTEGDQLTLRRTPRDNAAVVPLLLEQLPGQKINLTLGAGSAARVLQANSLWHLLLTEPET